MRLECMPHLTPFQTMRTQPHLCNTPESHEQVASLRWLRNVEGDTIQTLQVLVKRIDVPQDGRMIRDDSTAACQIL